MTTAEYQAMLEECNWNTPAVSKLITASHTDVMFDNLIREYQMSMPLGAQNFFGGFFGTEVWADGQGNDIVREYATDPYIPFTFSHFVKQVQTCDPNIGGNCDMDLCPVPEGGRGTLPGIQWYTWGFETKRTCIADIRHIRQFQYWASKVIRNRALIDEKVMYMFYVMAALVTAGSKYTLQGQIVDGNYTYVRNTDPRANVPLGYYNWMQEWWPQITNADLMMPLTMQFLDQLARRFELYPAQGPRVGTNSRGGGVYELWYPDDFYQEEVLRNPDYMKSLVYTMPSSLFDGYSLAGGDTTILGNWKVRTMPALPRFAPTAEGEVIPVDTHVEVPIEVGYEAVPSPEFEAAPFGVALVTNGRQGTIMTRPTLSQSGEGFPIQPIASNEPWQINNDYDKDCNKFKNKPFSYRRYNMGFRLDDPYAATAFLFRRRTLPLQPITNCDLAPIVLKEKYDNTCPITTIGCSSGKERQSDDITRPVNEPKGVECSSEVCPIEGSATFLYRLKVKRIPNQPDFNSLGCGCGAPVTLFVYREDTGNPVYLRQIQGVVKDTFMGFPDGYYLVESDEELAAGECIKKVLCSDETPLQANALSSWDATTAGYAGYVGVGFLLNGPIGCDAVGEDVQVRYYNAAGVVLGTVTGDIAEININTNFVRITSASPNLRALGNPSVYAGTAYIGVSCAQAGDQSSSSSGT